MIVNFYASDHKPADGRMSEAEEWKTTDEVRARAADLAETWRCDWVNVYESGDPQMLMQVDAAGT